MDSLSRVENPPLSEKEELLDKITALLEKTNPAPGALRQKLAIFKRLAPNLVTEVHADFLNSKRDDEIRTPPGETPRFADKAAVIRGRIFEMLVIAEFGRNQPVSEELVSLMKDPGRFSLEKELMQYRTPDLAFIEVDEATGDLIVRSAGEAKAGKLDHRALQQLGPRGFIHSFEIMGQVVNATPDLEQHGLLELARTAKKIRIADDFAQIIFLPSDRSLKKRDLKKLLGPDLHRKTRTEFLELLTDNPKLTLRRSSFSLSEIAGIADLVIAAIDARTTAPTVPNTPPTRFTTPHPGHP